VTMQEYKAAVERYAMYQALSPARKELAKKRRINECPYIKGTRCTMGGIVPQGGLCKDRTCYQK
jgi:hypothetical protein